MEQLAGTLVFDPDKLSLLPFAAVVQHIIQKFAFEIPKSKRLCNACIRLVNHDRDWVKEWDNYGTWEYYQDFMYDVRTVTRNINRYMRALNAENVDCIARYYSFHRKRGRFKFRNFKRKYVPWTQPPDQWKKRQMWLRRRLARTYSTGFDDTFSH